MADYTQNTDFSVKDALPDNDPEKDILGSDIDAELSEIQTAIASKYDNTDLATQAQAEAGTNNTTLMTPLRVAQFLGIGGAGGGTAGAIQDLLGLDDPGDDRILYWDESANAVTFLDIGSNLEITAGSVLNVTESAIDHDALTNFVANEHVDHTAVQIATAAGSGLTGGGTIAATRNLSLDIDGLTEETVVDLTADFVALYDASATANRKVSVDALVGEALGDGRFFRNSTQSVGTTEATVVYNTAAYTSNLQRGSFSTSTGEYTVGSDGARILISAQVFISAMDAGDDAYLEIQVNGTSTARADIANRGAFGASGSTLTTGPVVLALSSGDVVRVRVRNDSTKNIAAGVQYTWLSIVEVG